MASIGNSNSSSLRDGVAAALRSVVYPRARLVVGLSGGADSVALLAILADLKRAMGYSLRAVHVHHGISPNASAWAQFCVELCDGLGVPLHVERVSVDEYRQLGVEGAARHVRYAVYAREDADFVVLAHHRDDQAETLLLQLLRGAGPLGMAGMPAVRALTGSKARILRPLLGFARTDIRAWARERGLRWIDDESNDDASRQRNFVRHRLLPLVEERFPAARATLARAAMHQAESGALTEQLARMDRDELASPGEENDVGVAQLRQLGAIRAKNVLRSLLRTRSIRAPTSAQLDELWRQLVDARADRAVMLRVEGWELRCYRGRIRVERSRAPVPADFQRIWRAENKLLLLELGGVLRFKPEEGRGLSAERLRGAEVTVRVRAGGERLQQDARRPRRTLKNLFQEKAIPPWQRERWPLLYCGDQLICVPGIGESYSWKARREEAGLIVSWQTLDDAGRK